MPSDVYIFGYQSMLARGSLTTSIGAHDEDYVPARLRNHVRDWSAVRDFAGHPSKRYVHTADWRPAGRVAFANLRSAEGWVNGLCHRVPAGRLDELDFREQGYVRIEVGRDLAPYPGHALVPGRPAYAYIDPAPDPQPAPVSRAYYDMGRLGALAIARHVPGFAEDYLASTRTPAALADDLAFVFIGADGRHLWLLDEADSSLTLLLRFARPQFPAGTDRSPEADRPVTPGLAWLDLRSPGPRTGHHPRIPPGLATGLAGRPDPGSPCWLVRLAAVEQPAPSAGQLETLAADPDPWVRRAALVRLGDKR